MTADRRRRTAKRRGVVCRPSPVLNQDVAQCVMHHAVTEGRGAHQPPLAVVQAKVGVWAGLVGVSRPLILEAHQFRFRVELEGIDLDLVTLALAESAFSMLCQTCSDVAGCPAPPSLRQPDRTGKLSGRAPFIALGEWLPAHAIRGTVLKNLPGPAPSARPEGAENAPSGLPHSLPVATRSEQQPVIRNQK